MKNILVLLSMVCCLQLSAQNRELVETTTKNAFENKSYIYTNWVKLVPPSGGGSFRISAAEHGTFYIRPAEGAQIPNNVPQSLDRNFIRTEIIKVKDVNSQDQIPSLSGSQKSVGYEYTDGLGRPWQSVLQQQSPLGKDIVKFFSYENITGRATDEYLPYTGGNNGGFKTSYSTDQASFYGPSGLVNDSRPFSHNDYESSPLSRVTKTTSPGSAWNTQNRGNSSVVKIDLSGTRLFWKYNEDSKQPGIETYNNPGGYHPAGTLTYSEATDEENRVTRNFSDCFGDVVLKETQNTDGTWLQTYMVYDGLSRLRIVFPPAATANISGYLNATSNPERQDFLDRWAYQFVYDNFNRMSKSKVPGVGWDYFVYDKWDRLVLSQTAEQRSGAHSPAQWTFNKYDRFNRVAITGFYNTSASHSALQGTAMDLSEQSRFETSTTTGIGYSLNASFPTSGIDNDDINVVNYFDNYGFMFSGWDVESNDFSYQNVTGYPQSGQRLNVVKGHQTGSRVKVLDQNRWLNSVTYYTNDYYPIQVVSEAYIGGVVRTTNKYDFIGRIERSHRYNSHSSLTEEYFYTYDHSDRPITIKHAVNGANPITIVSNNYNELGQLAEKNLHSVDGATYLQSVDFRYNIRGWVTSINNSTLTPQSNDSYGDLFGMEIEYNATSIPMINGTFVPRKYYDGNISTIKWKTNTLQSGVTPTERSYVYDFDALSRLKKAHSATNSSGSWNGEAEMFNEEVTSYDVHGNINGLKRNAKIQGAKTLIDDLTYDYVMSGQRSDKLIAIDDATGNKLGFKPALASVPQEYAYDVNGNLEFDHNKSISGISYSYMNRPTEVEFTRSGGQVDRISYTYDALGNILSRKIAINNSDVWTTWYSDHYQYDRDHTVANPTTRLSHFLHPEGRVVNNGAGYDYEYFLTDYLGNLRVGFGAFKETANFFATMEPGMATAEVNQGFRNLNETRPSVATVNYTPVSEKTPNPDRAASCNGLAGRPVGPAKYIRVLNGDAVYMEVYAQYTQSGSNSNNILPSALVTALTAPTSFNVANSGETATLWSGFNTNAVAAVTSLNQASSTPKAYLVYLFFDDANNFVRFGAKGITDQAYGKFERLDRSFTATTNGHLYIYVANENNQSNVNVFFDEFSIIHQKNSTSLQVTQATDYYPFGLSFNEYNSDRLYAISVDAGSPQNNVYKGTLRNRVLFQGQRYEQDLDLDRYQFDARSYDPSFGRWLGIDPLASKFPGQTAYNFTLNNPVLFVDPDGRAPNPAYDMTWPMHRVMTQVHNHYQHMAYQAGQVATGAYAYSQQMWAPVVDQWRQDMAHWQGNPNYRFISHHQRALNGEFGTLYQVTSYAGEFMGSLIPGISILKGLVDIRNGDNGSAALNIASGAIEIGALAKSVKSLSLMARINSRLSNHLEYAVKNYSLSNKQLAAGAQYPNLMKAYTGSAIDKVFKQQVGNDAFLTANKVTTTKLFKFGPDVSTNPRGMWWDVTTPGQWNAHVNLYTPQFGTGTPLFYNFYPNSTTPYFIVPAKK